MNSNAATPPALALKISTDYVNSLDGLVLYEPVNDAAYQKLMRSDLLRDTFSCDFTGAKFANEHIMLQKYHADQVEIDGQQYIPVKYTKSANNPLGRCNPVGALGLFNIRREIRQTLVKGQFVDIDIVNAHPVMLHQILLAAKIPHPRLADYVANRATWIDALKLEYGITRDDAKSLVIAYLYGGGFEKRKPHIGTDGTVKKGLVPANAVECKLLEDLRLETRHIHKVLARHNTEVVAITKRIKADAGIEDANINGTVCSYILQEYESRILEVMYKYCVANGIIRNCIGCLCADGGMVQFEQFYEALPAELGAEVLRLTGFNLSIIKKEMEDDYCAILDDHLVIPLTEPMPAPPAPVCEIVLSPAEKERMASPIPNLREEAIADAVATVVAMKEAAEAAEAELEVERAALAEETETLRNMQQSAAEITASIQLKESDICALKIAHVAHVASVKEASAREKADAKRMLEGIKVATNDIKAASSGDKAAAMDVKAELVALNDAARAEAAAMYSAAAAVDTENSLTILRLKEEIRIAKKLLHDTDAGCAKRAKKVAVVGAKVAKIAPGVAALQQVYSTAADNVEKSAEAGFKVRMEKYKEECAKGTADEEPDGVWSDRDAAGTVLGLYPHFKSCQGTLWVFDDKRGLWTDSIEVAHAVFARFEEQLTVLRLDKKGAAESTGKSYGSTTRLMNEMVPQLKSLCRDPEWIERTKSSSIGRILFKNGYYDFAEQKFYSEEEYGFNPNVVFFASIDHDFCPFSPDDMEYTESIRRRLFHTALGPEVGEYLLLNFARGLAGDAATDMKRILLVLGDTNCGKTILTMALMASCGEYVGSFNGESLAFKKNDNGDAAQSLRWAMLVAKKRIIISNELTARSELNSNLIKKITSGGDPIIGRVHGGNETIFNTHFLPIMFANDMVKITPYDPAMDKRARFIQFRKSFVEEPSNEFELQMDPDIKHEIGTARFQRCFVGLLIRAYMEFTDAGKREVEPAEVIIAKELYVGAERGGVVPKFLEDFEITGNQEHFATSKAIEAWIKNNNLGITMTNFGLQMNKYVAINKIAGVESKKKKVFGKAMQCWIGLRVIPTVVEFDDEDGRVRCAFETGTNANEDVDFVEI